MRKNVYNLNRAALPMGGRNVPPNELTVEEKTIWKLVAAEKPAEWFTKDTIVLMKEYCRCAARADWYKEKLQDLQNSIDDSYPGDGVYGEVVKAMDKMVKWNNNNAGQLSNYARQLRLTLSARVPARRAGVAAVDSAGLGKPWEDLPMIEAEEVDGEEVEEEDEE